MFNDASCEGLIRYPRVTDVKVFPVPARALNGVRVSTAPSLARLAMHGVHHRDRKLTALHAAGLVLELFARLQLLLGPIARSGRGKGGGQGTLHLLDHVTHHFSNVKDPLRVLVPAWIH